MIDQNNLPKHIAIIMDGNGRWAKEKGLPRTAGHKEGVERVKDIIRAASDLGVSFLTLFAFSTENWARPREEVDVLMRYLENFLNNNIDELHKNNIRLLVIGRDEPIPGYLLKKISQAKEKTKDNSGLSLVLALNYGSRQEITDAARRLSRDVREGKLKPEEVDEARFNAYLYTAAIPDPDLFIRTSNELRISNFLLWQLSYAELYFTGKYWPDFRKEDLEQAIEAYQARSRRFGKV